MHNPKVSICIPTYNGEKYIKEALVSISDQTYTNCEVIVSDDDSTDDTLNIIRQFKFTKYPVKIFNHIPGGIGANWNNCIKNSNGKYIKFLFQDDILLPNCIENMVNVFEKHDDIGLVASKRSFIISEESKKSAKKWLKKFEDLQKHLNLAKGDARLSNKIFKRNDFLNTPRNIIGEPTTVMFKKEIVNEFGYFNEKFKQILDYEYWYRILKIYNIYIIDKPLVRFRIHSLQASNINSKKQIKDYELYPKLIYENYFWYLSFSLKIKLFFRYNRVIKILRKIKNFDF